MSAYDSRGEIAALRKGFLLASVIAMSSAASVPARAQTLTYQPPANYTTTPVTNSQPNPSGSNRFNYSVPNSPGWTDDTTISYPIVDIPRAGALAVGTFNGRLAYHFHLEDGWYMSWDSNNYTAGESKPNCRVEWVSATHADQSSNYANSSGWSAGIIKPGLTHVMKWSVFIPQAFVATQRWATLFQLHAGNSNFVPGGTFYGLAVHGDRVTFGNNNHTLYTGSLANMRGRWVDFALSARWSTGDDGLLVFYADGVEQGRQEGNNFEFEVTTGDKFYYVKQGYYRAGSVSTADSVYQTPVVSTVPGSAPSFTVNASPTTLSTVSGGSTSTSIAVTAQGGFSGTVSLSLSGLPANATASFNPASINTQGTSTLTLNSNTAPAGTYGLTVTGTSGSLSRTRGVTWTISPGAQSPTISQVRTSSVSNNSATITWQTDLPSSSQVEYGLTAAYGSSTANDSTQVTSHAQMLTGLQANATYHFRVRSANGSGTTYSGDYSFSTTSPELALQIGTTAHEYGYAVAADRSGAVYMTGYTEGSLFRANGGGKDTFITKHDSGGSPVWGVQFGGSGDQHPFGIALAADGSGVYVAGSTTASINGQTYNGGLHDAYLAKFSTAGTQLWIVLLGTPDDDVANAVVTDAGGYVYAAGSTDGDLYYTNQGGIDAWVGRYNPLNGSYSWGRQLGSPGNEVARGLAADQTTQRLYVVGDTTDELYDPFQGGQADFFIAQYSYAGTRNWTKSFGTSGDDVARAAAVSGTRITLVGSTTGAVGTSAGGTDAVAVQFDSFGVMQWAKQIGTALEDVAYAAVADGTGNIYLSGSTTGTIGSTNFGGYDAFTSKLSANGTVLWTQQAGTGGDEVARAVALGSGFVTLFSDAFNGSGALDSNWTVPSGSFTANGGAAAGTSAPSYAFWTGSPSADAISRIRLSSAVSTYVGAITRAGTVPDRDHYAAYIGPEGNIHLARRNDYTYTYLADGGAFPSGSHTLSITATGTNPVVLSLKIDGAEVLSFSDSSASRLTTAGRAGMFDYNGAGQPIDEFTVIQPSTTTLYTVGGTTGSLAGANQGGKDVFQLRYRP